MIKSKNNYTKIWWRISMNGRKDMAENLTVIQKRVIKDYAVGIYARVSTSHKTQMDSLSAQISGLTRLVAAHRTWFVADVFIDVAIADSGESENLYLYKQHHEGIISKEQLEAVQLEMGLRSNVEIG